ncbi:MAG: hypothetical protein HC896_16830 [Bacteroidales bacterium]|nr:hypothetical protein [Bacteroidales bacterium]
MHPDKEMMEDEKLRKEDLMKKVTAAYKAKDLSALLKLELEWVAEETHNLANLSDEKLASYIASLKEQVHELQMEKTAQCYNPRYEPINDLPLHNKHVALKQIMREEKGLHTHLSSLKRLAGDLSKPVPKKLIMEFVEEYVSQLEPDFLFDPFFDDDDDDFRITY